MKVYTFSEARQRLAALLDQARREGKVRIRRRDGQEYVVRPVEERVSSPFDVPGLDLAIPLVDVVDVVREGRAGEKPILRSLPPPSRLRPRKVRHG